MPIATHQALYGPSPIVTATAAAKLAAASAAGSIERAMLRSGLTAAVPYPRRCVRPPNVHRISCGEAPAACGGKRHAACRNQSHVGGRDLQAA